MTPRIRRIEKNRPQVYDNHINRQEVLIYVFGNTYGQPGHQPLPGPICARWNAAGSAHLPSLFLRHKEEAAAQRAQSECLAVFILESSLSIYLGALAALTIHLIWPWAWHISGQATSWALRSIRWDPLSATLLIFHNAVNYDNMRAFYRIVGGKFYHAHAAWYPSLPSLSKAAFLEAGSHRVGDGSLHRSVTAPL